jgi:hypothetical protein
MKKTIIFIIVLITTISFYGCTHQNPAISSINPAASISTASPEYSQANESFTLTQEDFEKLKAPLTVLANEYVNTSLGSRESFYDFKNGLSKNDIADYAWDIAYYFDYFYPSTSRDSDVFLTDNERYGIKKGDTYNDKDLKVHIPQKAINSILMSTFGEEALKGLDLNGNLFDANYIPKELKDGMYIFRFGDGSPEKAVLSPLNLPVNGNENTEFKLNFKQVYSYDAEGAAREYVNIDIMFKLKKDDSSEWGYNITDFNATPPVVIQTSAEPAPTIDPTAPMATVTPNPEATFTLTQKDFEKLKAPLMVWALTNEFNNDSNYDLKEGLTREKIAHYVWYIAYAFDYFDPSTPRYSKYYNTSIEKYGIKKGDLRLSSGTILYIPQKAINSILLSIFGEDALKGIDLNENVLDGVDNYGASRRLKDGMYIFGLGDDYPEEDVLGTLDLPVTANENTEFKISFIATYNVAEPENVVHYSITFTLKKNDTSEWGYNITAFNMQKDE